MVVVAFAGATTGFGLTALRTFVNEGHDKTHKLVLLSRSAQPEWTEQGIDVRPVGYSSHDSLVHALKGVHTVISFIGGSGDAIRNSQLALVAAAKRTGVKRFAPSEYAVRGGGWDYVDLYAPKREVYLAAKAAGLEVTRFECGLFMSVLATGTPKPPTEVGIKEGAKTGEEEALAGLRPWNYVINQLAGTADYPGDGSADMTLTDMRDVARFVIAALDLPTWPDALGMSGSTLSFKGMVGLLEKAQGRRFLTKNNTVAEMTKAATELPATTFYNQSRIALAEGLGFVESDLNKAFPHIKPVTAEEFVDKWWSGVKLGEPAWVEDKAFDF